MLRRSSPQGKLLHSAVLVNRDFKLGHSNSEKHCKMYFLQSFSKCSIKQHKILLAILLRIKHIYRLMKYQIET